MSAAVLAQVLNTLGLIAATLACVSYTIRWATSRDRGYLAQAVLCFGFALVFLPVAVGVSAVGPFTVVGALFIGAALYLLLRQRIRV